MNINELTIGQAKELANLFSSNNKEVCDRHPYPVGKYSMIRTVTCIYLGVIEEVYEHELVISTAGWVADTGRFSDTLLNIGNVNEFEPYPEDSTVVIGRGAIVDVVELPKQDVRLAKQK